MIYSVTSRTGSTYGSSAKEEKIFKSMYSCMIDGYEVIYKYSFNKDRSFDYMSVAVRFEDFFWDSGLNFYVASIRKHRNIYYVVVRNPCIYNEFSHAVIAVDSEKYVIIDELKDGDYTAAPYGMHESESGKISLDGAPSTMFIPYVKKSVRNQIQEVDVN